MNATNNTPENFDWNALFFPSEEEKAELRAEVERDELVSRGLNPEKEYKTCWKCGGTGHIPAYSHRSNGRCYQCGGSGKLVK